jgi:hypothetical protein
MRNKVSHINYLVAILKKNMVTITLSNKNSLVEKVYFEMQLAKLILDEEASFFLIKILENAQNKIERPNLRRTRPYRIRIVKHRAYVSRNIQRSDDLNSSINALVNSLGANSRGQMITSKTLFITFNGICPLWPFC